MTDQPPLTKREQQVAEQLATGASNQQIAARLVISEDTVKSHVKQILRKLAVSNRAEAALRLRGTDLPGLREDVLAPIRALLDAAPYRQDCQFNIAGVGRRVLIDVEELRRALQQAAA